MKSKRVKVLKFSFKSYYKSGHCGSFCIHAPLLYTLNARWRKKLSKRSALKEAALIKKYVYLFILIICQIALVFRRTDPDHPLDRLPAGSADRLWRVRRRLVGHRPQGRKASRSEKTTKCVSKSGQLEKVRFHRD